MKRKPLVVKVKDIEEIKREMMRIYDPSEYERIYWTKTDEVMVEYMNLLYEYFVLEDECDDNHRISDKHGRGDSIPGDIDYAISGCRP